MPFSNNNPFGQLPTNLPQPIGLPMPQNMAVSPPQMPQMPVEMPPPPIPVRPAQNDEFSSIMSGISGLIRQNREEREKKKTADMLQAILGRVIADKAISPKTEAPVEGKAVATSTPADMDDYMVRNSKFESGDNDNIVNKGSGATGRFQFLPSTWSWIAKEAPELGLTPEGIKNRDQQIKAMHFYTGKSKKILEPILGRKPTGGELYLLHLLGHSGGPNVLSALDKPITETISSAAYAGNPFLKDYKTGRDLIAGLNDRFGG